MVNEEKAELKINKADSFTQFMFGPNYKGSNISGESSGNIPSENLEENEANQNGNLDEIKANHYRNLDDWLFGKRHHPPVEQNALHAQINQIINNINFVELMENIDQLVSSAQKFKPLYSKISPMFKQIFKKN